MEKNISAATLGEEVVTEWSGDGGKEMVVCAITGDVETRPWALHKLTFLCNGVVGNLIGDTGASVTLVNKTFVEKAKLRVEEIEYKTSVQLADGRKCPLVGRVDLPVSIQLMVELEGEGGVLVHWDRGYTLANVVVADLGEDAPRDLYVAYKDFSAGPLAQLVDMIKSGARVLDTPRVPKPGQVFQPLAVEVMALDVKVEAGDVVKGEVPATQDLPNTDMDALKEKIVEKIPAGLRGGREAERLVSELLKRAKLFGEVDSKDLTETVEFKLKPGATPKTVSFKVPLRTGVTAEAAASALEKWIAAGVCDRVPWSEDAYGFVIMVPKPNGKWRVTVSPASVNESTEVYAPEGGYMPDSMLLAAQRVGRRKYAVQWDMLEAFTTMRLGPVAQKLSTFTSPIGKIRFRRGFFGYHSFPPHWQEIVLTRVVLPVRDEFPNVDVENWVDDGIVAADTLGELVDAFVSICDKILKIGGRINLAKSKFLVQEMDFCGIALDLKNHTWRIAPERVEDLRKIPAPKDREALSHVLGVLRYYFFGTHNHAKQRERIEKLAELDFVGARVSELWTDDHTEVMKEAVDEVLKGDWALCFNPSKKVYVSVDASGKHGYCVTAWQYGEDGKLLPVAFFSHGWEGPQIKWTPQVKEAYACRQAVIVYMPKHFPFANVVLLCDNRNLSSGAESEDNRVARWMFDIKCKGCVVQHWLPGEYNTIADYGSRSVVAQPDAELSAEKLEELKLYGLHLPEEGVDGPTVVPGHLVMAPMVEKIVEAQQLAGPKEREAWTGSRFKSVTVGDKQLMLFDGKMVVPQDALGLKEVLMRLAHDELAHYAGGERTTLTLERQAKVWWFSIKRDVTKYIKSCFKCQMVRHPHGEPGGGSLQPTLAGSVHHTWFVDIKGPMPENTGYLMLVVEAFSRVCKLRYLPRANTQEVCEELQEVILSFGTRPRILRCDGGPPFDGNEFKSWCKEQGIEVVKGLPGHSRGQGMVETRFKGIADALMASLGGKAPTAWFKGDFIMRLEGIINSTVVSSVGGSPWWVLTGFEPRTPLAARTDWTNADFGRDVLGEDKLTHEDYCNAIAALHEHINNVQGRALMASSLAQAITKTDWNKRVQDVVFKEGDWVLLHRVAPNRMLPHFTGPFKVLRVVGDGNSVLLGHYLEPEKQEGPVHVARLLPFDMSRATPLEIAAHQLEEGSSIVEAVTDHRALVDGSLEFKIKWLNYPIETWVDSKRLAKVKKALEYCRDKGLSEPGKEKRNVVRPKVERPRRGT